jgi:hypothetical protein
MSIITPTTDELRAAHKRLERDKLTPSGAELFITGSAEANDMAIRELYSLEERSWFRYVHSDHLED